MVPPLVKLPSGIPGLDIITKGGLPVGRTTLVAGTAGSGKTVLAAQFLIEGLRKFDEPGIFVTFEEPAEDIRRNMLSFGWNIEKYEAEGKWMFVDVSFSPDDEFHEVGTYDLSGLIIQITHALQVTGARRIAIDSMGSIFSHLTDGVAIRREFAHVASLVRRLGLTAILTAERTLDNTDLVTRFTVEEFVADNVVILRNVLDYEHRRRTIEILKFRGTSHQKGEFSFAILPQQGLEVIPVAALGMDHASSNKRISSGNVDLDKMCGGGFFADSIILLSGATGTGKTLLSTEFVAGGVAHGERSLLLAFEESRQQLVRNAASWGVDYAAMEASGMLQIQCNYPEAASLEDHYISLKAAVMAFKPRRVAVDSLSALERISSGKAFREFIISFTSFFKKLDIAVLFTATTHSLSGNPSITEAHISTITDLIVLLRYVESTQGIRRGITVLKMRGSQHDKDLREFTIEADGMHIGEPLRNVANILHGNTYQWRSPELAPNAAGLTMGEAHG